MNAGATIQPLLIPLDEDRFSAGKSANKWFDYAIAGLSTLASEVPPYSDVIDHGRTGWLVGPSVDECQAALAAALEDASGRDRVALASATKPSHSTISTCGLST